MNNQNNQKNQNSNQQQDEADIVEEILQNDLALNENIENNQENENMPNNSSINQKKSNNSSQDLTKKIEELLKTIATKEETIMRISADLQNVRRRAAQDRIALLKSGGEEIILKIMPSLDNFERALKALPSELKNNDWVKGILAIEKSIFEVLKIEGLKEINQINVPFNPDQHEAIATDEKVKKGLVAEVFQKGLIMNDKVIRPAKVKVGAA